MQAVIMAGGKGTRLSAITRDEIPKPMVPLLGKPLLLWQVECLKRNGVTEILMVIGHLGHVIRDYFGDGSAFGVAISYYEETEALGTAGALSHIEQRLDAEFFLVFGDILFDIDLERMHRFHREKQALVTLFVHPNSHPFDSDLVETDADGRVLRFDSKHNVRDYWYDNAVNAGLYWMDRALCRHVPREGKVDLEKEILTGLCARGEAVYAYHSPEYVKDVGTVERITAAARELEGGFVASRNLRQRQKAIFLDRDGTVNVENGLVYKPEMLELEPCAVEAIGLINRSGYLALMVTNQPSVARGLCEIEDVETIHRKLKTLLGNKGVYLDDLLFCPHHPDKGYPEENPLYKIPCRCRKPGIGMVETLAEKYNLDLSRCWMVGDRTVDVQTGINAGMKTALVLTGAAGKDGKYPVAPDLTAPDLLEAVRQILAHDGTQPS